MDHDTHFGTGVLDVGKVLKRRERAHHLAVKRAIQRQRERVCREKKAVDWVLGQVRKSLLNRLQLRSYGRVINGREPPEGEAVGFKKSLMKSLVLSALKA